MNALLYLVICFFTGYVFCSFAFPQLKTIHLTTFRGTYIGLNEKFVTLPVMFILGTILVTWTTYILAIVFQDSREPLIYANAIARMIFLIFSIFGSWKLYQKSNQTKTLELGENRKDNLTLKAKVNVKDAIFLGVVTLLSCQLMWRTFFVEHNQLYVGLSVFSDFSPHIGMIRSFSKGNNFPTMYSHFTGEGIRYHFMYQFLVGNLEFLGLRLDLAMNIPSAIGLISSFLLLFVLAVKMSGKRVVGYLSCLFFAFRSSKSLFTFLSHVPKGTSIWKALSNNTEFIGYTTNENWGLWNLNVYCNQRHLAFTIPILLFIIILFLPSVYESFTKLYEGYSKLEKQDQYLYGGLTTAKLKFFFRHCVLQLDAWKPHDVRSAIASGVIVGALSFWNGAVTIAILLVLFIMAITAHRKLEYLITALIAVLLSFIQSTVFIQGLAIKIEKEFGFIAENKTLFGTLDYIFRLTGILPFVLLLAFIVVKKARRYIMIAFFAPFGFAFFVSLTKDVTVNHKYIMLSLMLLSIYAAIVLVKIFQSKQILLKVITILTIITMTATGFYDYITVIRRNNPKNALVLNLNNSLTNWVIDNTSAKDTILSSPYALNEVVLGGGMLYCGWTYFGYTAGYDTFGREDKVKEMFEADTPESLHNLILRNKIHFIIVDKDCRDSDIYEVNEENIRATYQVVYEEGEGEWKRTIYDTRKLLTKVNLK